MLSSWFRYRGVFQSLSDCDKGPINSAQPACRAGVLLFDKPTGHSQSIPLSREAQPLSTADASAVIERYRQILLSAIQTGIITLDRQGCVTGWSEGAHHLLGWAEEEMLGHSLDTIFPEEDSGLLQEEMAEAIARGRGA